jgi:hypothetical protein
MSRSAYALLSAFLAGCAGYLVAANYNVGSILTPVPMVGMFVSAAAGILGGFLCWAGLRWSLGALALAAVLAIVQSSTGSGAVLWWTTLLLIISFVATVLSFLQGPRSIKVARH